MNFVILFLVSLFFLIVSLIIDRFSYKYWAENLVLTWSIITLISFMILALCLPTRYLNEIEVNRLETKYNVITEKRNNVDMESAGIIQEINSYNDKLISCKNDVNNNWFAIYYDKNSREKIRDLKVIE